jgi:hypothetical protein
VHENASPTNREKYWTPLFSSTQCGGSLVKTSRTPMFDTLLRIERALSGAPSAG